MKLRSFTLALLVLLAVPVSAQTTVPGHDKDRYDQDFNGYPDAGVTTVGHYTSVYAYDYNGDYFWDLGDGRIYNTVPSIGDLDQNTLTVCDYEIQYRGKFENTAFLDSGWIMNNIHCSGYDYPNMGSFNYLIVHQSDPRYTGNPDWAVWGTWEYQVLTEAGLGNLVKHLSHPATAVGSNK